MHFVSFSNLVHGAIAPFTDDFLPFGFALWVIHFVPTARAPVVRLLRCFWCLELLQVHPANGVAVCYGVSRPQGMILVEFMVVPQELEEFGAHFLQNMPFVPAFPCSKLHEQVGQAVGLSCAAPPCPRASFVGVPSDIATSLLRAEVDAVD